jgi:hypothetical protein
MCVMFTPPPHDPRNWAPVASSKHSEMAALLHWLSLSLMHILQVAGGEGVFTVRTPPQYHTTSRLMLSFYSVSRNLSHTTLFVFLAGDARCFGAQQALPQNFIFLPWPPLLYPSLTCADYVTSSTPYKLSETMADVCSAY